MFDTVGLNLILGTFFNAVLPKLQVSGLDTSRVKALTIISIDTFILIQHFLKDQRTTLKELLDAYHKDSNSGISGFVSFSDYVVNYHNQKFGAGQSQDLLHQLFKESNNFSNE